jgi:hypothetical protein
MEVNSCRKILNDWKTGIYGYGRSVVIFQYAVKKTFT